VRLANCIEARKGSEELIVAADSRAGNEAAHGERVDHGVVERLIGKGVHRALVAFAADRLGREAARRRVRLEETARRRIEAESFGYRILNKGLSVDRPGEVHVQVGALRHLDQEGVESDWAGTRSIEGADGTLLGWRRRGSNRRLRSRLREAGEANPKCGREAQQGTGRHRNLPYRGSLPYRGDIRKDSAGEAKSWREWQRVAILELRLSCWFPPVAISLKKADAQTYAAGALGDPRLWRLHEMPRPDSSVVERGPEKAGVGGSIPSLATTFLNLSI
jgi:hypothetical protein